MGLNELIFGGLAVLGVGVFVYVGQFRANRSQRERTNRPRWNVIDKAQSAKKSTLRNRR